MARQKIVLEGGGTMYVDDANNKTLKTPDGPKLVTALQAGDVIAVVGDCSIVDTIVSKEPA